MQGSKKWILPKEINTNRFFCDSHWLRVTEEPVCFKLFPQNPDLTTDHPAVEISCSWLSALTYPYRYFYCSLSLTVNHFNAADIGAEGWRQKSWGLRSYQRDGSYLSPHCTGLGSERGPPAAEERASSRKRIGCFHVMTSPLTSCHPNVMVIFSAGSRWLCLVFWT